MDIQCKIKLLDTIRSEENRAFSKAYRRNRAQIRRLKKENISLQKQVKKLKPISADKGLDDRLTCLPTRVPIKKAAMRMNFRVLPTVKKVNDQKYINRVKREEVHKVNQEYKRLQNQTVVHEREQEKSKQKIRKTGFSLEVMKFKCTDAKKSVRQFQRVRNKVEKNNLSLKCELNNLERLNCARDLEEVEKVERLLRKTLKERPELIINYKDKLPIIDDSIESIMYGEDEEKEEKEEEEEYPSEVEEIQKRVQNIVEDKFVGWMMKPLTALSEAMQKLQLEKLNTGHMLNERRKELQKIESHLTGMKAKPDMEVQSWLDKVIEVQQKYDTIKEQRNLHLRIIGEVKVSLMLLLRRLDHVKLVKDSTPDVSPDAEEFVLTQLRLLEQKLGRMQIEFQRQNLTSIE